MPADERLSDLELYKVVRAQIEHEDNLIGLRLNWFVASQSFLFTAYAIVLSNLHAIAGRPGELGDMRILVARVLPTVALASGLLILVAIIAGMVAMQDLRAAIAARVEQFNDLGLPPIQGRRLTQRFGIVAPIGMPIMFVAVWVVILVT
jgi:hypothetical protein